MLAVIGRLEHAPMGNPSNSTHLSTGLLHGLEDLAGEMTYARRRVDLGKLALLCYCDIRHWARLAGEDRLAQMSCSLITESPACNRAAFLCRVDGVIDELAHVCLRAGADEGSRSLNMARTQVPEEQQ